MLNDSWERDGDRRHLFHLFGSWKTLQKGERNTNVSSCFKQFSGYGGKLMEANVFTCIPGLKGR